jgi:hypothetical protein
MLFYTFKDFWESVLGLNQPNDPRTQAVSNSPVKKYLRYRFKRIKVFVPKKGFGVRYI